MYGHTGLLQSDWRPVERRPCRASDSQVEHGTILITASSCLICRAQYSSDRMSLHYRRWTEDENGRRVWSMNQKVCLTSYTSFRLQLAPKFHKDVQFVVKCQANFRNFASFANICFRLRWPKDTPKSPVMFDHHLRCNRGRRHDHGNGNGEDGGAFVN